MRYLLFIVLVIIFLLVGCSRPEVQPAVPDIPTKPTLASVYADNFLIGAALSKKQLRGGDSKALDLAAREFSSITPENDMKWGPIHPTRDTFKWGPADTYVAFGEEHDLFTIGHALVWYLQVADYVGKVNDPAEMRAVLKEHIDAVAGRYKGRIDGWDVLNEAVEDNGKMRKWPVFEVLGEDYVAEVFKMARAADPNAELYYNDYNLWMPAKREGVIRMVKKAIAAGAPIDGIGMQGHYSLTEPRISQVDSSIRAFSDLGLKVMITELDVTVLPNPWANLSADPRISYENTPFMNPYPEGLPDSVATALANRYAALFRLFLKHDEAIARVTTWGIYDGSTWLNGFPIKGRTNYPLLFDRAYRPKAAYEAVMGLKD